MHICIYSTKSCTPYCIEGNSHVDMATIGMLTASDQNAGVADAAHVTQPPLATIMFCNCSFDEQT